jgi:hypothetical protein
MIDMFGALGDPRNHFLFTSVPKIFGAHQQFFEGWLAGMSELTGWTATLAVLAIGSAVCRSRLTLEPLLGRNCWHRVLSLYCAKPPGVGPDPSTAQRTVSVACPYSGVCSTRGDCGMCSRSGQEAHSAAASIEPHGDLLCSSRGPDSPDGACRAVEHTDRAGCSRASRNHGLSGISAALGAPPRFHPERNPRVGRVIAAGANNRGHGPVTCTQVGASRDCRRDG